MVTQYCRDLNQLVKTFFLLQVMIKFKGIALKVENFDFCLKYSFARSADIIGHYSLICYQFSTSLGWNGIILLNKHNFITQTHSEKSSVWVLKNNA